MRRILVTGGGISDGHVMTIVSVLQELQSRGGNTLLWVGSKHGRERRKAEALGIPYRSVMTGKFRRYISFHNFADIFRIPFGVIQSFFIIRSFRPDIIFASGGSVSVPTAYAGFIRNIPVVIHESDVKPGLANRLLAKKAKKIFVSFPQTKNVFSDILGINSQTNKIIVTGIPIRSDITNGSKEKAQQIFKLESQFPTLLIIGGGQGSRKLNQTIHVSLEKLLRFCQVVHICGEKNFIELHDQLENKFPRYHLFPYLDDDLKHAYAAADLVLTRGGAHTLHEISYYGIPSIIVPHASHSSRHQLENARLLKEKKAAVIIPEEDFSPAVCLGKVEELLLSREQLLRMRKNAQSNFVPRAAQKIVTEMFQV